MSPDHRWLACAGVLDGQYGIWLQDVSGDRLMHVAPVAESKGVSYYGPVWAPDGRNLVFASFEGPPPGENYRLWIFSVDGEASNVFYECSGFLGGIKWSPDGSSVAAADGDQLRLVYLDRTYSVLVEEGLTLLPLSGNGLAWSPDGSKLVYPMAIRGVAGLIETDILTFGTRTLWPNSDAGMVFIPSWSPDGRQIAVLKGRYSATVPAQEDVGIVLLNADGSNPVEIGLPSTPFELSADLLWSPDGTQLATILRNGTAVDLWLIPVRAGGPYQLTESGDIRKVIGWTPDGEGILVSTWEAIEVVPVG